jgi:hypothetical protein
MSAPSNKKRSGALVFWAASLTVSLGVVVWASVAAGGLTGAAVFLGFGALSLAWVALVLGRAAMALVREPARDEEVKATGRRRKELEREKQALLKALKELELDHQMGKISEADYREIGGQYRQRAIGVLRALDLESVEYKELIERDVKHRREALAPTGDGKAEPADEKQPADEPKRPEKAERPERAAAAPARRGCGSCGTDNDPDAVFCKKCGARVDEAQPASEAR